MTPQPHVTDAEKLEDAIRAAERIFASADTRDLRCAAWSTLAFLHRQRTPDVVARMERELGLR